MIHLKKIIMIACCVYFSAHAIEPEFSPTASDKARWNFEIYNKSSGPIWVSVGYNIWTDPFLSSVINKVLLPAASGGQQGGRIRAVVDFKKELIITIKGEPNITLVRDIFVCQDLRPGEQCTKQAFLTYDNDGLRPQTGKWVGIPQLFGLAGTTESGLEITNNVTQFNIKGFKK